jgi:uncharacterized membrane protein YkvA (DUF1232 family)
VEGYVMKNFSVQSIYNWYRNTIRNPKYRWWIILGTLGYLFSPIDISPDVFPIIGWIDDGILVTLLVTEVSQMLIDRVKSRSPQETVAQAEGNRNDAGTVDVDAVSMK